MPSTWSLRREQAARHPPIARSFEQEPAQLVPRLGEQHAHLGHDLALARHALAEDAVELDDQRLGLLVRRLAQERHPRPVHVALIQALAQLHRLVEERSECQVEERLVADHLAGELVGAEERMALLLHPEEHGALVVSHQLADLRERDVVDPVAGE